MTAGACVNKKAGEEEDHHVPTPPDGGWGWVVVFGSFMIHIIADGVTYTFGIFFVEFLHYYGEGKGATAWIASILVGITLGAGPIASALTNKYGCRAVTIAGAILATVGFVVSLFAPNIATLYFTIGICAGLGFGLIYLPAIVTVTCYFEKKRAFATGIAVCGSGLGTFIFAPFIEYLVERYGWKGAMLLVSGIILNCTVFGALFRPLSVSRPKKSTNKYLGSPAEQQKLVNGSALPQNTKVDTKTQRLSAPVSNGYVVTEQDGPGRLSMSAQNLSRPPLVKGESQKSLGSSQSLVHKGQDAEPKTGVMYRKDIFYSGSLLNIPQYKRQVSWPMFPSHPWVIGAELIHQLQLRSNPSTYTASITHIPKMEGKEEQYDILECFECSKETQDTLREMMDLTLLKDPIFLLFAISNFCTSIGFNVPYVYIKDRALLLGIANDDSSFLIAIIGIANTISRVVLGYISDKPWLNRLYLYNTALTICGLGTMFSAFCLDYLSMAFYAALFGTTAGAYVGLTSVILVDLLGLEKLTNAFGLLLLFQGVASLLGPPIAGWLYDGLGSYNPGFYVAGSMIAISGAMLFLIPVIRWWQAKHEPSTELGEIKNSASGNSVKIRINDATPPTVSLNEESEI